MSEKIDLDPKTEKVFTHKGYTVLELLASGAFGKVYKASRDKDGIYAAVKVMEIDKMSKLLAQKFLPREIEALTKIRHPYILEVFDIFKSNRRLYIFMEFAPNGDLSGTCMNDKPADMKDIRKWFKQTADALSYMHELNFVHRDIKLQNIMLSVTYDAKLTDFGFSRLVEPSSLATTICGTTPYYSPEVHYPPYDAKAADVWAMGCVLFALCLCKLPFSEWPGKAGPSHTEMDWRTFTKSQREKAYKKRDGYKKLPSDIRDLIEKCMEPDVKKRITAAQILQHNALKGF